MTVKLTEILQRKHEEHQKSTRYYVEINVERVAPADIFRQEFWHYQTNLRKGDILRCVASDGSYDFELRVNSQTMKEGKNLITVSLYPILPDYIIEAAQSGTQTKQMATHFNGRPVPRVEQAGADGWRVIGFSGEVVSKNHPSQAAATLNMAEYINNAKIDAVAELVDSIPDAPEAAKPAIGERPGQISYVKKKEMEKREKKLAERREIDARNKARTAERQAAEAAAGDAA